jgi:hypothetical protein
MWNPRTAGLLQTLRHRGHLVRIIEHAAHREALGQVAQRALDRRLEDQRFFRARLENAVADKHDTLRRPVERHPLYRRASRAF